MSYNQPTYGRQSLEQEQHPHYQQQHEQAYRPASPASHEPPVSSFYVQALYAYSGADTSSLSFRQGDIIEVLSTLASGWWDGVICEEKVRGWFPSNYVQRISEEDATWAREQMAGWWDGWEDGDRRGSGEYGSGDDMGRNQRALEDLMRGDDPHDFSSGGDILSEIAAASQASSLGMQDEDEDEGEYGQRESVYGRRDADSTYQEASPYEREGGEGEDDEEDFWVPKVTTSGQLFYYNTRTGETSRDMPIDGEGDGVQIHSSDFAPEDDEKLAGKVEGAAGASAVDSSWSAKLTPDGSAVFYENSTTGECSWSPPPTSRFHQQSRPPSSSSYAPSNDHLTFPHAWHGGRGSTGDASVISGWTARAAGTGEADAVTLGKAETLRRGSDYSDDSALDGEYEAEDPRESVRPQAEHLESERTTASPRRTRMKGRKTVARAELLAPPPPPLLVDLEQLVGSALRDLIDGIGFENQEDINTTDPALERDRIAALGDSVVEAVRTLLHASGVLEQVTASLSPTDSPSPNEIATSYPRTSALSHAAQVELRPATRRITSTLSKLVLSVRAVWGLLETVSEDQLLDQDEIPAEGPEEEARREELNQQTFAGWARACEGRLEMEDKLRSEVLHGAREVQNCVGTFVADVERVLSASAAISGAPQVPKELLRAPKALQGSLRTNAAALLLPGGGFGGNWRGNGFVTLPTPNSTPSLPSSVEAAPTLAYTYPSRPVNAEVAAQLQRDSTPLLDEAEATRSLVVSLLPPPPPSTSPTGTSFSSTSHTQAFHQLDLSPNHLVDQAAQLQQQLALFLFKVEDIDVAASVDFELVGEAQSRPGSRRDTASGSGSFSTSGKSSDAESVLDPPTAEYRSSVKEARPLLAELEISKQALYDIAPALLASIQELYMSHNSLKTTSPTSGAQPLSTSPLAFFAVSEKVEHGPDTVLAVLSDLRSAVNALCSTLSSLGAIADVQAAAPRDLRRVSLAFRSSLSDSHGSFTGESRGSDLQRHASMSESITSQNQTSSGSHSHRDDDGERRASVDSDFFFPGGAQSTASGTVRSKGSTKTSQLFSPGGASWEQRRGSVATSTSSMSDSLSHRRELPLRLVTDVDPVSSVASPTRTTPSKSKLAKILGADPSQELDMRVRPPTEPIPAWLGADYGPDEVSFNLEGQIKGGTLRALVIAAASHEGRVDSNYLSAFLMTYRTFCTSHQLLDFLIARFLIEPPTGLSPEQMQIWETRKQRPIKARVANVIKSWVREHMDHDEFDAELLRRIADFASSTMRDPVQSPQIIKAVEDRLSGATRRQGGNLAPGVLPPSIIPRNLRKLKFMDIDPLELARQLTLMDGERFAKITPQECLGKAWPKEYGSDAPNISKMIDMSNCVTRWVTETILGQDELKKRANTIKQFIAVAERCLALNNFSTLIHIIAGLNSTPIHRLRRTWETVNQKAMISLGMLNNIMRPDKNYKEYREALRGVAPPCVPFLGVYLTDWTFIGDGNPDMLREKPHQINFNKRQKASELILMIKLHQSTTYNLAAVPQLKKFLETQLFTPSADPAMDDQRLYEISLTREPRERDDEKIARLLSESGFL